MKLIMEVGDEACPWSLYRMGFDSEKDWRFQDGKPFKVRIMVDDETIYTYNSSTSTKIEEEK